MKELKKSLRKINPLAEILDDDLIKAHLLAGNVEEESSRKAIKKHYLAYCRKVHPDKQGGFHDEEALFVYKQFGERLFETSG